MKLELQVTQQTKAEYDRRYFEANRERIGERNRKYRERNREKTGGAVRRCRGRRLQMLDTIKVELGCRLCAYNECADALQFHHRDPTTKKCNVSTLATSKVWKLQAELDKCDVLCANCHCKLEVERKRFTCAS